MTATNFGITDAELEALKSDSSVTGFAKADLRKIWDALNDGSLKAKEDPALVAAREAEAKEAEA